MRGSKKDGETVSRHRRGRPRGTQSPLDRCFSGNREEGVSVSVQCALLAGHAPTDLTAVCGGQIVSMLLIRHQIGSPRGDVQCNGCIWYFPMSDKMRIGREQGEDLVPRRGLEPPRSCPHQHLKLACLPISPPRQWSGAQFTESRFSCQHFAAKKVCGFGILCANSPPYPLSDRVMAPVPHDQQEIRTLPRPPCGA